MYQGKHTQKIDNEKLLREYEKNQDKEGAKNMLYYILIGLGIITIVICLGS